MPQQNQPGQDIGKPPMKEMPKMAPETDLNPPLSVKPEKGKIKPRQPLKPKKLKLATKKPANGLFMKIMIAVLAVLFLGLAGAGTYFYLDTSGRVNNIDKKIGDDHNTVTEHKDKIGKIETSIASFDSLKQKVDELEKKTVDYAVKKELDVVIAYLKLEDTDNDGLSDYEEVTVYKSNRFKKDTDGDGYSDKDEVDNNFNPNGPGQLGDTLTEDEAAIMVSDWAGSLWSTVAKAEDLSLTLAKDGKLSGSFSFKKEDNVNIKNRVTGTYNYNGETGKFDAILVNYLYVQDNDNKDATAKEIKAAEEGYKMNLTGTFSKESKSVLGSWEMKGTAPAQWPVGNKGSFQMQRSESSKGEKLEEATTDTEDMTKSYQTVSVKAFSYGYLPATINLTVGEKVKFEVTSLDVDHTFTIDDLDIDIKAKGGQTTTLEYTPKTAGTYEYYSSESGQKDAGMVGTLVVKEKKE